MNLKYSTFLLLLFFSCRTSECTNDNFFATYEKKYSSGDTTNSYVQDDLKIKKEIFGRLCIDGNKRKVLLVEGQGSTQSFFSNGLIFIYDDSTTFYYKLKNGNVECGKGTGKDERLVQILNQVKDNFELQGTKIKTYNDNQKAFDVNFCSITLFNSTSAQKVKTITFKLL